MEQSTPAPESWCILLLSQLSEIPAGNSSLQQPGCAGVGVPEESWHWLQDLLNVTTGSGNKGIKSQREREFNWSSTPKLCRRENSQAFPLELPSSLQLCTPQIQSSLFLLFVSFSISFPRSSFSVHSTGSPWDSQPCFPQGGVCGVRKSRSF